MVADYKFFIFFPSSTNYEYSNFQFLKHDKYAQGLCMQNFQIWLEDYRLIFQNKNNPSKIQNKVTCKGIEPQFFINLWRTLPNCNTSFLPKP